MLSDVFRFRRRLQKLKQVKFVDSQAIAALSRDIEKSISTVQARKQNSPLISYPSALPIAQKSELIKQTILENQVTILCGETGSGKTTQLPKICLDIDLGIRGKIGHTQPRRLAARAVSQRIAEELNTELGNEVGFKVRFSDKSNDNSYIKLMTDGILLAECHHDPFLNQYDTIIIDEAHERSLNIDFLLGYLRRLIQKRKDLKIIITSATIDPDRFSRHFNHAPVINVSGRTYPVEVRYRPRQSADREHKLDLQQGIIHAVNELSRIDRGDILVFLSGERDIRETAEALAKEVNNKALDNTEVLPLLARLSNAEQNRIFHPSNKRRIVLATNVAETSLTVPGIKYVIDSGVARISRYSWRSKIQRLPIEKISQASANQRMGRCGRVSAGICIRLYEEEDFKQREEFTEPEIKRTSLAAVILQMEYLRLGHINDFPFVEPPEDRLINDGYKLLFELGAIDECNKITKIGKHLGHFPIDPKLARILLQAKNEKALSDVLIIVSALATQDPRERPLDKQQAADEKHAAFKDKLSDFIFYINLWLAYHAEKKTVSTNQLRKWCKKNFISWMRMREWIDTHNQINRMLMSLKLSTNASTDSIVASYDQIHRSLLTGLLANTGFKDEGKEYLGARSKKFYVYPGSALFKASPKWIMAAEIVETSRVYARINAKIDPLWIAEKANHLLKYHYNNPHWEKNRSQVVALEQASLYGLVIYADKKVNYGRINPAESKEIFIRGALIGGGFESTAAFYIHNQQLLNDLERLEAKSRRHDIIVDDTILYDFYDHRLPDDICSGASLDKWLRYHREAAKQLFLSNEDLIRDDATIVSDDLFPDMLEMNASRFPLEYHFDPRNHCDGITLVTPVVGINAINPQRCEWLIPGLLQEKIIALIKSLPKPIRKNFVPAPNFAAACMEAMVPSDTALSTAVANQLKKMTGVQVPYDAWNVNNISPHLRMNFRIIANDGNVIEQGRDLQLIKERLSGQADAIEIAVFESGAEAESTVEQEAIYKQENVGPDILDSLGKTVEINLHGITIKSYPALVKAGKRVNLRALESRKVALAETHNALRQLIINALPEQIKHLSASIPDIQNLCLKYTDFGRCDDLKRDMLNKTIDEVFLYDNIQTEKEFNSRLDKGRGDLHEKAKQWSQLLSRILDAYRAIKKNMKAALLSQLDTVTDIQLQLNYLFPVNFITTIDSEWLQQYPRYLMGINKRLEKAKNNPNRDRQLRLVFSDLWGEYIKRQELLIKQHIDSDPLSYYRWMLEEYRVSLFAQELKTKMPVSEKRLKNYWHELSDT